MSFHSSIWAALRRPTARRTSVTVTLPSTPPCSFLLYFSFRRNHLNATPHSQPNKMVCYCLMGGGPDQPIPPWRHRYTHSLRYIICGGSSCGTCAACHLKILFIKIELYNTIYIITCGLLNSHVAALYEIPEYVIHFRNRQIRYSSIDYYF